MRKLLIAAAAYLALAAGAAIAQDELQNQTPSSPGTAPSDTGQPTGDPDLNDNGIPDDQETATDDLTAPRDTTGGMEEVTPSPSPATSPFPTQSPSPATDTDGDEIPDSEDAVDDSGRIPSTNEQRDNTEVAPSGSGGTAPSTPSDTGSGTMGTDGTTETEGTTGTDTQLNGTVN